MCSHTFYFYSFKFILDWLSLHFDLDWLPTYLPTYHPSTYLPSNYLPTIHLTTYLSFTYLSIYPSIYLPIYLPTYLSIYIYIYIYIHLSNSMKQYPSRNSKSKSKIKFCLENSKKSKKYIPRLLHKHWLQIRSSSIPDSLWPLPVCILFKFPSN